MVTIIIIDYYSRNGRRTHAATSTLNKSLRGTCAGPRGRGADSHATIPRDERTPPVKQCRDLSSSRASPPLWIPRVSVGHSSSNNSMGPVVALFPCPLITHPCSQPHQSHIPCSSQVPPIAGQEPVSQARPGQARPGQARPGQARPGQVMSGQARPGSGQARVSQARVSQARPGQARQSIALVDCLFLLFAFGLGSEPIAASKLSAQLLRRVHRWCLLNFSSAPLRFRAAGGPYGQSPY